jgi:hypothetical protein
VWLLILSLCLSFSVSSSPNPQPYLFSRIPKPLTRFPPPPPPPSSHEDAGGGAPDMGDTGDMGGSGRADMGGMGGMGGPAPEPAAAPEPHVEEVDCVGRGEGAPCRLYESSLRSLPRGQGQGTRRRGRLSGVD